MYAPKVYFGWYGVCPEGGEDACEPFKLVSDTNEHTIMPDGPSNGDVIGASKLIKLIVSFENAVPQTFSGLTNDKGMMQLQTLQELKCGSCYTIQLNPGTDENNLLEFEIPEFVIGNVISDEKEAEEYILTTTCGVAPTTTPTPTPTRSIDFAPLELAEEDVTTGEIQSFDTGTENTKFNPVIKMRMWGPPHINLELNALNDDHNKSGIFREQGNPNILVGRVNHEDNEWLVFATGAEQDNGVLEINTEGNAVTIVKALVLDWKAYSQTVTQNVDIFELYDQYKDIYSKKNQYTLADVTVMSGFPFYNCVFNDKTYRLNFQAYPVGVCCDASLNTVTVVAEQVTEFGSPRVVASGFSYSGELCCGNGSVGTPNSVNLYVNGYTPSVGVVSFAGQLDSNEIYLKVTGDPFSSSGVPVMVGECLKGIINGDECILEIQ